MIDNDNCGCTPPPVIGAKGHWECTPIPDTCKPVELTDKLVKEMYENNVNTEAFTTIDKARLDILHNNMGSSNGAVKEIIAGKHIRVDNSDPSKPVVSTDGVAGPKGDIGLEGPQGIQGTTGIQGPKGDAGISWHLAGRDTEANIMNKTGVPGDMWIVAEPTNPKDGHAFGWDPTLSPAGWRDMGQFKGDKGSTGSTGVAGPKGSKGDTGGQGVPGTKGPKGDEGAKGPIGVTGLKGSTGGKGIQGVKGDKGDAGKDGTGVSIKGQKADEAAIKLVTGSKAGDMWLAADTGHGWVSDGATPTVWTDAGSIQGPKGDIGSAGTQGVKGDTGIQGIAGPKGDTGIKGSDGADGHQGIQGVEGPKGDKGDDGALGPIGLKGDTGLAGPNGPQGPQGPTGPQGHAGNPGKDGSDASVNFANDEDVVKGVVTDKVIAPDTLEYKLDAIKELPIDRTKFAMSYDVPAATGKWKTAWSQGLFVAKGKLVISSFLQNDTIKTMHPDEKVRISVYNFSTDGSHQAPSFTSNEISMGHGQSIGYFKSGTTSKIVGQGPTPHTDMQIPVLAKTVINDIGHSTEIPFPNAGRSITIGEFDPENPSDIASLTEHTVVKPFSKADSDTWWYFGTPNVSADGKYLVVAFASMKNILMRKVNVYLLDTVIGGNYIPLASTIYAPSPDFEHEGKLLQGVAIDNDNVYLSLGRYGKTNYVVKYDIGLAGYEEIAFRPNETDIAAKYENEGITIASINGIPTMITSTYSGAHSNKFRIFVHGEGEARQLLAKEVFQANAVNYGPFPNVVMADTSAYRVVSYDATTKQYSGTQLSMYQGRAKFGGNSIGLNYSVDPDGTENYDTPLGYANWGADKKALFLNASGQATTASECYIRLNAKEFTSDPNKIFVEASALRPAKKEGTDLGQWHFGWNNVFAKRFVANDKFGVQDYTSYFSDGTSLTVTGGIVTNFTNPTEDYNGQEIYSGSAIGRWWWRKSHNGIMVLSVKMNIQSIPTAVGSMFKSDDILFDLEEHFVEVPSASVVISGDKLVGALPAGFLGVTSSIVATKTEAHMTLLSPVKVTGSIDVIVTFTGLWKYTT